MCKSWPYSVHLHIANDLTRDLFEDLFSERTDVRLLEVAESDELDYVALCGFSSLVSQDLVVTIEYFHVGEICVAYPDNDDAQRVSLALNDQILRFRHVIDAAVCQDEEAVVLFELLIGFHVIKDSLECWHEEFWSFKYRMFHGILIEPTHVLEALDQWILFPCKIKAVGDLSAS